MLPFHVSIIGKIDLILFTPLVIIILKKKKKKIKSKIITLYTKIKTYFLNIFKNKQ